MTKESTPVCPACGNLIPVDAPEGLCGRCLFLGERTTEDHKEFIHSQPFAATGDKKLVWRPPSSKGERPEQHVDAGAEIGQYRLLEKLGEGGFGVVWKAEQSAPLKRTVALKLVRPGLYSPEIVARFSLERQALAVMDHPHIARVYDAGVTNDNRPYFVMELVDGMPLTSYCDKFRLPIQQRLRLFTQVCRAVQHAHQKGVIHRDLKPSNILVATSGEGEPVPKVIDFGLAKALTKDLIEELKSLHSLGVMGTPIYMSPEQALGEPDLDIRTDLYSLGVVLYELLTGQPPFDARILIKKPIDEVLRKIREDDPPKPSARLSDLNEEMGAKVAGARACKMGGLMAQVRGDLDWIVFKAIEKDRERRYESAGAMAEDIRRYLAGEAVGAAPPSAAYRIGKLLRRHRAAVVAVSSIVAALVAGLTGTVWQWREAVEEREELRRQKIITEKARDAAEELVTKSLFDLRDKLKPLGRLHLLDEVSKGVEDYYRSLPVELKDADVIRREGVMSYQRGMDLMAQGRLEEAIVAFRRSVELAELLHGKIPVAPILDLDMAVSLQQLGAALITRGAVNEASNILEQGIEFARKACRANPSDSHALQTLASALASSGDVFDKLNRFDQAIGRKREAIDHLVVLTEMNSEDESTLMLLALAHYRLSETMRLQGDLTGALDILEKHEEIVETLRGLNFDHRKYQREMGAGLCAQSRIHLKLGDFESAIDLTKKSIEVLEPLTSLSPSDFRMAMDLSQARTQLGDSFKVAGMLGEAVETYRQASREAAVLVSQYPENFEFLLSSANIEGLLGGALKLAGDLGNAISAHEEALEYAERALEIVPEHPEAVYQAVGILDSLSSSLIASSKYQLALERIDRVIEITTGREAYHWRIMNSSGFAMRGEAKLALGDPSGAQRDFVVAAEILEALDEASGIGYSAEHNLWMFYKKIGDIYMSYGAAERALECYESSRSGVTKQLDAQPNNPNWHHSLFVATVKVGEALKMIGDVKGALDRINEANILIEGLSGEYPHRLDFQNSLAGALDRKARFLLDLENLEHLEEAQKLALRAASISESLSRAEALNSERVDDVRCAQSLLAKVYEKRGFLKEAIEASRKTRAIASSLSSHFPENRSYRRDLGVATGNLAAILWKKGEERNEAFQLIERCVEIFESLCESAPDDAERHKDAAIAWNSKADFEIEEGRFNDAETSLSKAVLRRKAYLAHNPSSVSIRRSVAVALDRLAGVQSDLGRSKIGKKTEGEAARILGELLLEGVLDESDLEWLRRIKVSLRSDS